MQFMMAENQSDTTSDNVLRDWQGKIDRQEFPNIVCPGYLNIDKLGRISGKGYSHEKMSMLINLNRPIKRIEIDPIDGPLWIKLGHEVIRNKYSLCTTARRAQELGLIGRRSKKAIVKSTVRITFANPFLYGMMRTKKGLFQGNHEPLFSKQEWEMINEILVSKRKAKYKKDDHNKYNALCLCGECGRPFTTESPKYNGLVYLRCTKTRKDYRCKQPYIEIHEFERQIEEQLGKIQLSERFIKWCLKQLEKANEIELKQNETLRKSLQSKINIIKSQQNTLFLKWLSPGNLNGQLISDTDYKQLKEDLGGQLTTLEEESRLLSQEENDWVGRVEQFLYHARDAANIFHTKGDNIHSKYLFLKSIGSNIVVKDKKVTINFNIPYSFLEKMNVVIKEETKGFEDQQTQVEIEQIAANGSLQTILRRG